MATPHYLRFARALALVSGLAAPGCAASHTRGDGGTEGDAEIADASVRDSGSSDAGLTCASCGCYFGPFDAGDTPDCNTVGLYYCCATTGPLFPPDLPA